MQGHFSPYYGECQPISSSTCVCPNPDSGSICGSDNRSYKSECFARCLGIGMLYPGSCGFVGNGCQGNCAAGLPPNIASIYQAYLQYFPGGQPLNPSVVAYQPYFANALSPYASTLGLTF